MPQVQDPPAWLQMGRCRQQLPEIFVDQSEAAVEAAKKICAGCGLQERCREFALTHRIDRGTWGGTSVADRQRILQIRSRRAS